MGDTGRLTALATRFTVHWASTDGIVPNATGQYPPLFPLLIGKASVVSGVPAWKLIAPAEIVTVSATIIVSFVLWLRLTSAGAALVISVLGVVVYGAPFKAYEVAALAVLLPWILATFAEPPRGRMHWLPAGLIAGAMVLTYYAYLIFAGLGLLLLALLVWRRSERRMAYLGHLLKVVGVAAAVSCWYVIPYAWSSLHSGQQVMDVFNSTDVSDIPLPFLSFTLIGMIQLAGLIGLAWFARTEWWAPPILLVVGSAYLFRALSLVGYVGTGHTFLFYYTTPLITDCLVTGCVLALSRLLPQLTDKIPELARRFTLWPHGVAVVTILGVFSGFSYWTAWMPAHTWAASHTNASYPLLSEDVRTNQETEWAHVQPFPDGHRPRFASYASKSERNAYPWIPVSPVQTVVDRALGSGASPHLLAYNEEFFAYRPWQGYVNVDRCAALSSVRFDDRVSELTKLSKITDPATFAVASSQTRFGPIDVFVLHQEGHFLVWRADCTPQVVRFNLDLFGTAFAVTTDLPGHAAVAIRNG